MEALFYIFIHIHIHTSYSYYVKYFDAVFCLGVHHSHSIVYVGNIRYFKTSPFNNVIVLEKKNVHSLMSGGCGMQA